MAESSRLAVTYNRATDVTYSSRPGISTVSFELDDLPSLAVIPNLEASAAILSIAFRVTYIEHLLKRDCWFFRSNLSQNILHRMEAVWCTSRSRRKLFACLGKQTSDDDRTRSMGSRHGGYATSNSAKLNVRWLTRSRPPAPLFAGGSRGSPVSVTGKI